MGMGKTGIPWVPWDSYGNGSKISHGMGMGIKCMGMGVKTWELSPATVNSLLFGYIESAEQSRTAEHF